jgi:hypothetical protein
MDRACTAPPALYPPATNAPPLNPQLRTAATQGMLREGLAFAAQGQRQEFVPRVHALSFLYMSHLLNRQPPSGQRVPAAPAVPAQHPAARPLPERRR